jgi:hypothetical protein
MTKAEMIRDEAYDAGFADGVVEARAGMSGDLRRMISYFNTELRALRIEITRASGQPEPPPLDVNGCDRTQ